MSRLRRLFLILFTVLMIGASSTVGLAHNVYGTTGLLNIPTASVLPSGSFSLAYNYFRGDNHASVILGAFPGVEVGLATRIVDADPRFAGNVKVQLLSEGEYPAIAVGLNTDLNQANFYLVGSMQIGVPGVRGHLGFGSGRYKSGFAGISSVLNPVSISTDSSKLTMPLTTFMLEFDGRGLNTGVIMKFANSLETKFLLTDFQRIGFGVSFSTHF